ncbi:MAG: hypothetical protein K2J30_03170, partial [Clostridia bacterium]|nr:hypothetical protein [Clostridia bacterium]
MKNRENKKNKKGLYLKVSLAMLMTACVVTGGVFAAQNFTSAPIDDTVWEQGNGQASSIASSGGYETIEKYYTLKAGKMKTDWEAAIGDSTLSGKTLHFKLDSDWNLDTGADALTPLATPANTGLSIPAGTSSALTIPANYDIILDLNGHTISRTLTTAIYYGEVIHVKNNAKFTLEDTAGGGKITGGKSGSYWVQAGGCAGGIVNEGTFVMNGGRVTGNTGTFCGGVENYSDFTLNGGLIDNNTNTLVATDCACSGVSIYAGSFTMNGGTIKENHRSAADAHNSGAQLLLFGDATSTLRKYTINGGTIAGGTNTTTAIDLRAGVELNIYGGEITKFDRCPVMIFGADGSALGNPLRHSGTGYTASVANTVNFYGGIIHENDTSAVGNCTVLIFDGSTFAMYGGEITKNNSGAASPICSAVNKGITVWPKVEIHGGRIHNNTTIQTEGMFYMNGPFLMDGGMIDHNTVTNGHVVYMKYMSGSVLKAQCFPCYLYGGAIVDNTCGRAAVGYFTATTNIHVKGAPIVAGNSGGDVLVAANNNSTSTSDMWAIAIDGRLEDAYGNRARIGVKFSDHFNSYSKEGSSANSYAWGIDTGASARNTMIVTNGFATYYSDEKPSPNLNSSPDTEEYNFTPANTFFFANDVGGQDLYFTCNKPAFSNSNNVHEALLRVNDGSEAPFNWEYEENGTWYPITGEIFEFTYGEHEITNVRAWRTGKEKSPSNQTASDPINYDIFSTEYTAYDTITPSSHSGAVGSKEFHSPLRWVYNSNTGATFSGVKNAGSYTFGDYDGACPLVTYSWTPNASIQILVKPKEVKVNLKTGQKVTYGYNAAALDTRLSSTAAGEIMYEVDATTPLVGSDTAASLGVIVKHSYGTDAGKNYTMVASLPTTTNYN